MIPSGGSFSRWFGPIKGWSEVEREPHNEYHTYQPHPKEEAHRDAIKDQQPVQRYFFVVYALLGLFLVRLLWLQTNSGGFYRTRADQNRLRDVPIIAPRGNIVDRNNKLIAQSVPNFILTLVRSDLPKESSARSSIIDQLVVVTGLTANDIEQKLSDKRRSYNEPLPLVEHIAYETALKWSVALAGTASVYIDPVPMRQYPDGPEFANVIGYIGKISDQELAADPTTTLQDWPGKTGLEKIYQADLRGQNGYRQMEHDVSNLTTSLYREQPPTPGNTIQTTLDVDVQRALYAGLKTQVEKVHSQGGAAVAVDTRNGEILALVSYPGYENNDFITGTPVSRNELLTNPRQPLMNRAISGQYPSGSIVKPFIAAAALAESIITPYSTINSSGGFRIGASYFPDWKAGGHGLTNVIKALSESVNTFFYSIGGGYQEQAGLGVDRIVSYLQKFGWGQDTNIDLLNEMPGLLPTKEWRTNDRSSRWMLGDTYHLSIGQGDLLVTPLQVAMATAAVANGGQLYKPHLVQKITVTGDQMEKNVTPIVTTANIVPDQYLQTVRLGMRQGVLTGSSRALSVFPVPVAGKTGTAQFGNQGKTHAWYTCFAPYGEPEIAITVIVEGGGEGYASALPIAREGLKAYFHIK